MNERLKELMVEAGYAAPELAGRANKLAELIVKECAARVAHNEHINWLTAANSAKDLKRHFGVKE